jgi:rubredoxin-NAD+ reductase
MIQSTQGKPNENSKYRRKNIMKYICDVCGWEYDEELGYPEGGIAPGTKFEDLPADFECPLCAVDKDNLSAE